MGNKPHINNVKAGMKVSVSALVAVAGAACGLHAPPHAVHHGMVPEYVSPRVGGAIPKPEYFPQRQDHFDDTNQVMWPQAYYKNPTYANASANLVFLCVGGEGPALDGTSVLDVSVHCSNMVEFAKEKNAMIFAIEHRYYGCHNMSACPSTTSMQYLSSRQAAADIASFVDYATTKYNMAADAKWMTWGGSYPGMLASFARLLHPDKIFASVASSAPVNITIDNRGYFDTLANAYKVSDQDVGGSVACHDAIRTGHENIGDLMNTPAGQRQLENHFGLAPGSLASREDRKYFAGLGVAYFPAQDNDPTNTAPGGNIGSICKIMLNTKLGDEIDRLAYLRNIQRTNAKNAQVSKASAIGNYWNYQTCHEFGFYQTCEIGSNCFFVQGLYLVEDGVVGAGCPEYGLGVDGVRANIARTKAFYGGTSPNSTRVLWPNGEVDPWSALGVLTSNHDKQQLAIMVEGASHHAWTHPSKASDQPAVKNVRNWIREHVSLWLDGL